MKEFPATPHTTICVEENSQLCIRQVMADEYDYVYLTEEMIAAVNEVWAEHKSKTYAQSK
ncbi:MAG: hypothetical protein ACRCWJ_15010 [Casimicrobium sp.]